MKSLSRLGLGRALILALSGLALSGATAPSPPVPELVFCLNHDGQVCRLVSPTVALSVTAKDGDAAIQYFAPAQDGFIERAQTRVRSDLEARVVGGSMSEDEAAAIFAEILANPYVAYRLPPNQETLNQDVGFAPNVQLSPQDQIEVLRAHLQMSLSVSAVTSRYLSDGLGLRVIEPLRPGPPVNAEDPNLISESQELLATPSEPAASTTEATEAATPAPPTPVQKQGSEPQPSIDTPPEPQALPAPLPPPLKTNPPTERITNEGPINSFASPS